MHEASIANNVIQSVLRLMEQGVVPGKVTAVCLKIGKLSAVVPDNLTFMFNVLCEDGPLKGVKLEIEEVPARVHCDGCGAEFDMLEEVRLSCRDCGSSQTRLVSGRELLIDSVEVE
jgi:hydrogenase nickel incorporation protein HypA/HybF